MSAKESQSYHNMTQMGQFSCVDSDSNLTVDIGSVNRNEEDLESVGTTPVDLVSSSRWIQAPTNVFYNTPVPIDAYVTDEDSAYYVTPSESWATASNGDDAINSGCDNGMETNPRTIFFRPGSDHRPLSTFEDLIRMPLNVILDYAKLHNDEREGLEALRTKVSCLEQRLSVANSQYITLQVISSNCSGLLQKALEFIHSSNGCQAGLRNQLEIRHAKVVGLIRQLRTKDRHISELKEKQRRSDSSYADNIFGWTNKLAIVEGQKIRLECTIRNLTHIIRNAGIALSTMPEE